MGIESARYNLNSQLDTLRESVCEFVKAVEDSAAGRHRHRGRELAHDLCRRGDLADSFKLARQIVWRVGEVNREPADHVRGAHDHRIADAHEVLHVAPAGEICQLAPASITFKLTCSAVIGVSAGTSWLNIGSSTS